MKRRFTIVAATLALLAIFIAPLGMNGQVVSGTTYNTLSTSSLPTGWSGSDGGGTSYIKLTASSHYIQTSGFGQNGFSSIKLKARKFGGPTDAQALITVSWYYNNTETVLGTITPSNTTLTDYTISSPTNPAGNTTGYIKIQCKGAGSSKGSGVSAVTITYTAASGTPTTYTVTYDSNGGTGTMTDSDSPYNAGATVTVLDNEFTRTDYTFDHWNTAADDSGTSYDEGDEFTINANTTLYAQWAENTTPGPGGNTQTLIFNVSSNPGNWPTTNETTLTNHTYTLNSVDYIFALKNVKCNSGYLMMTQVAVLGLPALEGYKLTKVVAHNSGGCSTSTQVGISSSASTASYIAGGAAQTWSTTGSTYTYNLTSTEENTMYYLYVTNKNAQVTQLDLTYEAVAATTVATPVISPASGTEFGDQGLSVTIACETTGASIYYTLNGDTPDNQSTLYNGAISLAETTTVKAIAFDGTNYSNVATATYTYVDPNAPGTQNNPYTVAQARAAIDSNTGLTDVYATGIISQVDSYSSQYHSITYWISDDGTTTNQLEVYSGKGLNNTNFTSINDVEVGATVVVYGTLKKFNDTYEFDYNNYLVSYTAPQHDVATPTFNPVADTYATAQNVSISCATSDATIYYTIDGTEPTSESAEYTDAISVTTTTTIKAIAIKGAVSSNIVTSTYHINSQDNPYTVAQAVVFNEYPTSQVYVHGIVSTAPSSLSSGTLTYYISDDGTTSNQIEVYKGKDLNNVSFTSTEDIQVGDIVTVYGSVQIYNSTFEIGSGNYLVSFERPTSSEPSITVSPASVNLTAEEQDGTLDITYANIEISGMEDFDVQFYTVNDGQEQTTSQPSWVDEIIVAEQDPNIGDGYVVSYVINENNSAARTTYFKVFVTVGRTNVYSNLVTINQAEYVAPSIASLPFTFDGGRDDIEETEGLTYEGLGTDYTSQANTTTPLKFDNTGDWLLLQFDERPGTLTFDITGNGFSGSTFKVQTSEDGVTYTDLATYTELGATQNEEFTNLGENVRYIKWIYTNKSSGNVGLGNIVLNKYVAPAEYTLTIGNPDHITITAGYGTDGVLQNEDSEPIMSGTEITLTLTFTEGYNLDALTVVDGNNNPVNYTAVPGYENVWTFNMPNSNVTVNATAVEAPVVTTSTYTLATTVESGKTYIIVGWADNVAYAMGYQKSNNRHAVEISVEGNTATATIADTQTNAYEFTITSLGEDLYSIEDATGSNGGYLYAAGSNANNLKTESTLSDDSKWAITVNAETGLASVVATKSSNRNVMQFNNNNILFACYASASQHPVYFYEKVEAVSVSYSLEITGYNNLENTNGGYHLIASPVQSVTPSADNGFLTSAYDLYRFDQAGDDEGNEWLNYEVTPFDLVSGQGYLYASSTDTELVFEGAPYMGNGQVTLYKKDCSNASGNFEGWNLVGNPFAQTAYIDRDCYVMNENRNQIVAGTSREVAAMEGVFVIAASDGETMIFSTTPLGKADSKVVMNVIDNQGVADRAIVRFGEGSQLPKFQLKGNSTKVYFQQGQEEFAIVSVENEGELPVNFKASRNGRYTMSVDIEDLDMNYLHLIDNKTGMDVDLLQTPSYTFQASTGDYESRFRLVFDANNENGASTGSATFAYFNGTEWVVNNNGNATLQVIDMLGRVLSSQTISGNANVNINQVPGVYMFRLVNGNDVKVQKVVVR